MRPPSVFCSLGRRLDILLTFSLRVSDRSDLSCEHVDDDVLMLRKSSSAETGAEIVMLSVFRVARRSVLEYQRLEPFLDQSDSKGTREYWLEVKNMYMDRDGALL